MGKSLLLNFVPTPFWALTASGSDAGAVIRVLAAKAISPVSFVVYLTEKGVSTAAWPTETDARLNPSQKANHRTVLTGNDHMTYLQKFNNQGVQDKNFSRVLS
jgi:hypothetical protein